MPHKDVAGNAKSPLKSLVARTGFEPVISALKGQRVSRVHHRATQPVYLAFVFRATISFATNSPPLRKPSAILNSSITL